MLMLSLEAEELFQIFNCNYFLAVEANFYEENRTNQF
jgi:hypothetical protein